ncbi:MAG: polymer-forming cytoskeletal protein [Spirochaetaceae bacterium]|jgi:cytoskeletal protein CcmA (bactofilin family)|nr:polymer-forming cytoskeletal protein [Spirochaetaceae bacterium]
MPSFFDNNQKDAVPTATFSKTTRLKGFLRFDGIVCIMGKFSGTIEAKGDLIVGKGAKVECDHIYVRSITAHGSVTAHIKAEDKVDLMQGSEVRGDIRAGRLRIADGVLFEGRCSMIDRDAGTELFSLSTPQIKAALRPDIYGIRYASEDAESASGMLETSPGADTPEMAEFSGGTPHEAENLSN